MNTTRRVPILSVTQAHFRIMEGSFLQLMRDEAFLAVLKELSDFEPGRPRPSVQFVAAAKSARKFVSDRFDSSKFQGDVLKAGIVEGGDSYPDALLSGRTFLHCLTLDSFFSYESVVAARLHFFADALLRVADAVPSAREEEREKSRVKLMEVTHENSFLSHVAAQAGTVPGVA